MNLAFEHILSPAKLNLFLHINGQRPDGYHLLQSVIVAIDWFDILHFERRNDGKIKRHDLNTELPQEDLTIRAAQLLQKKTGVSYGVDISIEKHIPMQAGLGGGSSNAATTLTILNQLWKLGLSQQELQALALSLGADVPFFIQNNPAWVEGIGEKLTPIDLPKSFFKQPIAVLKPNKGVATKQIFLSPLLTRNTNPVTMRDFTSYVTANIKAEQMGEEGKSLAVFRFGHNDMQNAAMSIEPQISEALNWLKASTGQDARMTGSGSAVFAVLPQEDKLLKQSTNPLPSDWQFKMCKILNTHPYEV